MAHRPQKPARDLPLPSAAEVDILAVLWRLGRGTVRDVHEALGKGRGYTTTLKQMQLMTEKGLLSRREQDRSHVYDAAVPKELTQRQIAADLVRRAFGGSAKSLVLGALSTQPASAGDLQEIRRLIDGLERAKGRP